MASMEGMVISQHQLGLVVIGRNEGERLRACLRACAELEARIVYVDSGSTDGSIAVAQSFGAQAVALDMQRSFTAARARNAGFEALLASAPQVRVVQFLDGDCELIPGWIVAAQEFLRDHSDVAAVCGRRRERWPERSVYNRLCDFEWNTRLGEALAFGGDVLIRADALKAVGGYREDLIAGEEPELCVRLRAAGWKVWRIDRDMTWHDAAMTRWKQWWLRSMRAGHAFAEGAALHGRPPERHFVAESRRALVWGAGLPLLLFALTLAWPVAAWLWLVYPLQWARIALKLRRARQPEPALQAAFFLQGRFAEATGALRYWWGRLSRRRSTLIEYK
jgi:glycosyltransferase involved in cell wall biosynthesis